MKERCTKTLVAACTAALLFAGAVMADGPQRDREARDSATTSPAAQKIKVQPKSRPMPIPAGDATKVTSPSADQGGVAGSSCGPGAGDCCSANDTPGCEVVSCCELVCSIEAFCCAVIWDEFCAELAVSNCDHCEVVIECGTPGTGSCCLDTGTPFCDDAECCQQICAVNPFCCDVIWDQSCANLAADPETGCEICQAFACPNSCGGPGAISCCAANIVDLQCPFCDDEDCCAAVCAVDPFCCDTAWDYLCALEAADLYGCEAFYSNANIDNFSGFGFSGAGGDPAGTGIVADLLQMVDIGIVREITFSIANFAASELVDVEFDLIFMPVEVVDGTLQQPNPNHPNTVTIPVDGAGVGLPSGFFGFFFIADDEGFFDANDVADFPLALWAGIRFNSATYAGAGTLANLGQVMFNPPDAGFSDDFFWWEHPTAPGFYFFGGPPDNPAANFLWELLGETVVLECGDPGAGSCFEANNTPACDNAACCNTVCACDPFCCNTAWDAFCVGPNLDVPGCSATDLCDDLPDTGACNITTPAPCPADLTGDGNVGVADLLALLAAWGPNPGHPADLTGDGNVGVADLLALLAAWGSCPPPTVDCQVLSSDACAAAGGAYQGDGTTCP